MSDVNCLFTRTMMTGAGKSQTGHTFGIEEDIFAMVSLGIYPLPSWENVKFEMFVPSNLENLFSRGYFVNGSL